MTFFAVIIISGIISAMVITGFSNNLKVFKKDLEAQIRALTERIDTLESDKLIDGVDSLAKQKIASPQSDDSVERAKSTAGPVASTGLFVKTEARRKHRSLDKPQPKARRKYRSPYKPQPKAKSVAHSTRESQVSTPSKFDQIVSEVIQYITNYFKTGNTVVKIGIIVLFFGVSFLVKFAAEQGYLPIELRLAAAALGGIALTQLGWRLRLKKPDYALAVQGGGIGVLFITTFASLKLYSLIPTPLAFFIFVGLAVFTAWLAVVQNSKSLAVAGIVGGFLAPILIFTGQENHVILLCYYALLNCGIVAIAWFKSWRILNLLGFIFTYVISSAWGILYYQNHLFWTIEPFLLLFFLIYVAIPILFAKRQPPELKGYIDGTLIFGNTLIAFALQIKLVHHFEYAMAYSAFFASFFYLVLARWLYMKKNSNFKLLVEVFMALGTIFATITIPLTFDGHLTAAVWAAEAAGIYWVSLKQNQISGRIFSSVLIFAAGVAFIVGYENAVYWLPILNSFYLGCLILAISSLFISFLGFQDSNTLSKDEKSLIPVLFLVGSLWWIIGGYVEIEHHLTIWWHSSGNHASALAEFPVKYVKNLSTAYVVGGLTLCSVLGRKLNWDYFTKISFAGVAVMAFSILRLSFENTHPFAYAGYLVWPLTFAFYYYILRNNEGVPTIHNDFVKYYHAITLWLLAIIGAWEMVWAVKQFVLGGAAWETAAYALTPVAISAFILLQSEKVKWPLNKYYTDYLIIGIGPILTVSWIWMLLSNLISHGDSDPLMYLPLLNPLEAVQAFFMVIFSLWLVRLRKVIHIEDRQIGIALGGTYFFWLNGVLMRTIHHFADVPFTINSLFSSPLVQMSLSIYWSIIGISLMLFASKKNYRWLWMLGSSLLGIVVIKLFLIDLSKSETIERIVSFISVGLILLLVGYFSPIPPNKQSSKDVNIENIQA